MVDDVDFYIEETNPKNRRQYRYRDRWLDADVFEETIRVKDGEPVKVEILVTRHGPIIDWLERDSQLFGIAAQWAFNESSQPAKATFLLAKAQDAEDVLEALTGWTVPGQNFVFADTGGNIGFICGANIPIRSKGDGLLPVPGWTGEYEWKGYVPAEARPQILNPKEGFIATANNKMVGNDYPHFISHYWDSSDRILRIRELLSGRERLSPEDFKEMQADVLCESARNIVPRMVEILDGRVEDPLSQRVREALVNWDFLMKEDSVAACLFEVAYRALLKQVFQDELGEDLFGEYLQTTVFPPRALRQMFDKGSSSWFDDIRTPEPETLDDMLARSLSEMLSELRSIFGEDMAEWTWGGIHALTFEHPLGKKRPFDQVFNVGPFAVDGSNLTVNVGRYLFDKPYRAVVGASVRMIVDLSNMDRSLRILPPGQSGQLGSSHYKDQVDLYLRGRYHPIWTKRDDLTATEANDGIQAYF
jgi:penicillin amidase